MHYPWDFEQTFKVLSTLGGLGTFIWTVYTWREKSHKQLEAAKLDAERASHTHRLEATKPFLDRQLKLYIDATQAAAIIATSENEEELRRATTQFWQLYWGELALVENRDVEAAMVTMGRVLSSSKNKSELQKCSLQLAHACRMSLDRSWGINAWTSPDHAADGH